MAEITLTRVVDKTLVPFVVKIENEETNQTEVYRYHVKRLGGKAAMQVNLLLAEFARDKNRDALLGSAMMTEILKRTTKDAAVEATDDQPAIPATTLDLLDLFDIVDDKGLESLATALVKVARSDSTGE